MRTTNAMITLAAGILLTACGKQEAPAADTAKPAAATAAAPATASKLGETPSMKTPESVRYDADLDVFFVSNINGNPSQHDGNGFIAIVRADSTGVVKMLVEGGKNGATLGRAEGPGDCRRHALGRGHQSRARVQQAHGRQDRRHRPVVACTQRF